MEKLGLWFLALLLAILVGLLGAKVVLSVATLFELSFIADLGYLKIYGVCSLIGLLNHKHTDDIAGENTTKEVLNRIYNKAVFYLVFWGLSFFMYWLISNFGG